MPIEIREDESLYGTLSNAKNSVSGGLGPVLHGLGTICLVIAFICGILFAYFYFKAKTGLSFGKGGNMAH